MSGRLRSEALKTGESDLAPERNIKTLVDRGWNTPMPLKFRRAKTPLTLGQQRTANRPSAGAYRSISLLASGNYVTGGLR